MTIRKRGLAAVWALELFEEVWPGCEFVGPGSREPGGRVSEFKLAGHDLGPFKSWGYWA